jgi:hypothetical protein
LTQALKQALALVDVRVLDHFIVAGTHVCIPLPNRRAVSKRRLVAPGLHSAD